MDKGIIASSVNGLWVCKDVRWHSLFAYNDNMLTLQHQLMSIIESLWLLAAGHSKPSVSACKISLVAYAPEILW